MVLYTENFLAVSETQQQKVVGFVCLRNENERRNRISWKYCICKFNIRRIRKGCLNALHVMDIASRSWTTRLTVSGGWHLLIHQCTGVLPGLFMETQKDWELQCLCVVFAGEMRFSSVFVSCIGPGPILKEFCCDDDRESPPPQLRARKGRHTQWATVKKDWRKSVSLC